MLPINTYLSDLQQQFILHAFCALILEIIVCSDKRSTLEKMIVSLDCLFQKSPPHFRTRLFYLTAFVRHTAKLSGQRDQLD